MYVATTDEKYTANSPPKDRRFEQNSQTLASILWEGSFKKFPPYRDFFLLKFVFHVQFCPGLTSLVRRFSVFCTLLSVCPQCVCVCIFLLGTPFCDASHLGYIRLGAPFGRITRPSRRSLRGNLKKNFPTGFLGCALFGRLTRPHRSSKCHFRFCHF